MWGWSGYGETTSRGAKDEENGWNWFLYPKFDVPVPN
jgi:hypothetical protein